MWNVNRFIHRIILCKLPKVVLWPPLDQCSPLSVGATEADSAPPPDVTLVAISIHMQCITTPPGPGS